MTTYVVPQSQLGHATAAGVWTDDTGNGSTLNPAGGIVACQYGANPLHKDEMPASASLPLVLLGAVANTTWVIYAVVHRPTFAAWSTSNPPNHIRKIEVGRQLAVTGTETLSITLDVGVLNALFKARDFWNGYIPLVITGSAGLIGPGDLTVMTEAAGWAPSLPELRDSRPDFCPRCGNPTFREDWVRDGYTKSRVCTECYDPPDPGIAPSAPARRLIGEES